MRTLHSWGALHPLTAALKALGTQVQKHAPHKKCESDECSPLT
jgi:hypothetical protein